MGRTIKEVTSEHRRVAYLRSQGKTHKQIAEETGFSEPHVKTILRNDEIKALVESETTKNEITGQDKAVEEVLNRSKLKAVQLLEQVITDSDTLGDYSPSLKNRIEAAIEILGMCGISSKHSKLDVEHKHVVQPALMEKIIQRASDNNIIEVEAECLSGSIETIPDCSPSP